jgi:signal transduction histidine kinase
MQRYISLTEKLVLYFVVFGIFTLFTVVFYSYFNTKKAITKQVYDRLTSLRIEKKNQIERFFSDRIHEADLLSNTNQVILLINSEKEDTSECMKLVNQVLNNDFVNYFIENQYFSSISFIDTNLNIINIDFNKEKTEIDFCNNNFKLKKRLTDSVEIIDFDINDTIKNNFPIVTIIHPVSSENLKIGYIVFGISFAAINSIMLEENQFKTLGETGEIYLVGNDFLFRSSSRFENFKDFKNKIKTKGVINALADKTETEIITDYRGEKVLSSYSKLNLKNLDWVILAEIDKKEAMVPVISLSSQNVFLTIFVSFAVFIFAYFISKNITTRVITIKNAAQKVGKGDFTIQLGLNSNDEIGNLAESFNLMVLRLKTQSEEIEKERTEKLSSLFEGQEIERQRLSRELHDGLGQKLIATKLLLESFIYHSSSINSSDRSKRSEGYTFNLRKQFDEIIDEIRRMSNNLMPSVLKEFGLKTAVENLCSESQNITGIEFIFETNGNIEITDEKSKNHIYRIIQEALNNSIKHSRATKVYIYIEENSEKLTIIVKDNGIGFNSKSANKNNGNGLNNISERVNLLSGKFEINSEIGKGTRIKIEI